MLLCFDILKVLKYHLQKILLRREELHSHWTNRQRVGQELPSDSGRITVTLTKTSEWKFWYLISFEQFLPEIRRCIYSVYLIPLLKVVRRHRIHYTENCSTKQDSFKSSFFNKFRLLFTKTIESYRKVRWILTRIFWFNLYKRHFSICYNEDYGIPQIDLLTILSHVFL